MEDVSRKTYRQFYSSLGFLPLEEFPELWGKENPCLMLVKVIQMPEADRQRDSNAMNDFIEKD